MNLGTLIKNVPPVVKNLFIINLLVLFGYIAFEQRGIDLNDYLALHHWSSIFFMPHQSITANFLHASYSHLFSNFITLIIFGITLERILGSKHFLILYMSSGVGAYILQLIVMQIKIQFLLPDIDPEFYQLILREGYEILKYGKNYTDPYGGELNHIINTTTVGASGAVFGVLLGAGMLYGDRRLMFIPIKIKHLVLIYGVMEFSAGITNDPNDNVAHTVHLGGMLFAFILLKIWKVKPNSYM